MLAEETVHLNGYGTDRQLTLYEYGQPTQPASPPKADGGVGNRWSCRRSSDNEQPVRTGLYGGRRPEIPGVPAGESLRSGRRRDLDARGVAGNDQFGCDQITQLLTLAAARTGHSFGPRAPTRHRDRWRSHR